MVSPLRLTAWQPGGAISGSTQAAPCHSPDSRQPETIMLSGKLDNSDPGLDRLLFASHAKSGMGRRKGAALSLDPKRRGQQAEGQGDGHVNDFQNAMHRNSDNAKRQQHKPKERVGNEGQNSERPAEYEKNAPEQECKHCARLPENDTAGRFKMFHDRSSPAAR